MSTKLLVLILSILGLAAAGGTALYYGADLFEPDRPAELAAQVPAELAALEASVALEALEAARAQAKRDEAELAAPAAATIEEARRANQRDPRRAETIGAAEPVIAEGDVAEAAPPRATRAWETSDAVAGEVLAATEEERAAPAPAADVAAAPSRPALDAPASRAGTAPDFEDAQRAGMIDASEPVAMPPKAMGAWKASYAVADEVPAATEEKPTAPASDVAAAPPRPIPDAPARRSETAPGFEEAQLAVTVEASQPVAAPPKAMQAWKPSYAVAEDVPAAAEEEWSAPASDVAAAPPRPIPDAPARRSETAPEVEEIQLAVMVDTSESVATSPKAMRAWKTSSAVAEEVATAPEPVDRPEVLPPPPLVAIETVEVEDPGQLHVGGQADPHATVRLYVNGDHLADARAGEAGAWRATGARELGPGRYVVRADIVDDDGKRLARSEMQFDRIQVVLSEEPSPATPVAPTAAAPPAADVTEGDVSAIRRTMVHIERGDNLWHIARAIYGQGIRYTTIYAANRNQIRNPDLIYPGQTFTVPLLPQSAE